MRSNFYRPTTVKIAVAAVALAFGLSAGLRADEPAKDEAPVLSEEIGDGLAKVEPLVTAGLLYVSMASTGNVVVDSGATASRWVLVLNVMLSMVMGLHVGGGEMTDAWAKAVTLNASETTVMSFRVRL